MVEGSVNIQKLIIAQDALGHRKANRRTVDPSRDHTDPLAIVIT